jgi:hypothetical protein
MSFAFFSEKKKSMGKSGFVLNQFQNRIFWIILVPVMKPNGPDGLLSYQQASSSSASKNVPGKKLNLML